MLSCYLTTSDEDDDHWPEPLIKDKYEDAAAALALARMERMVPAAVQLDLLCKKYTGRVWAVVTGRLVPIR